MCLVNDVMGNGVTRFGNDVMGNDVVLLSKDLLGG